MGNDTTRTPDPATAALATREADDRVGLDLARLAHELRTPLSAIAVVAEIMRDERLGPLGSDRYRGYAADILASATQANSVLASLLDPDGGTSGGPSSGQSSGKSSGVGGSGVLSFVELDPAEMVAGAVSALEPLAQRSGIALRAAAGDRLPRVIADRRCLRQILDNLFANALKYTPPGGEIVVSASYAAGGPVTIAVTDDGDGMTAAELERARSLEPAPEPLRRRSGGTGIGLPLVRALATALGASLEIDSAPGKGTCVTVVLPHGRVVPV